MALSEFQQSTIVHVEASFGFCFFDVHPDDITKALVMEPDEVQIRGTTRQLPHGPSIINSFNSWGILSTSISKDVNEHLREILRRIDGKELLLNPDFGIPNFGIVYKSNYLYSGTGPVIDRDVLQGIFKFKGELSFDIYQVDQELSEEEKNVTFRRMTRQELRDLLDDLNSRA